MSGYHAKKRLGQNFLHSDAVVRQIVSLVDPQPDECVVEIGSGRGALTLELARTGAQIIAVEFDRDLIAYLKKLVSKFDNVEIVNEDFLKWEPPDGKFKLVGNLPFNITSPVIDWIVDRSQKVMSAVLMMQKEVADRLTSSPGSKSWSPLAIMTQLSCSVEKCMEVSPDNFRPRPKVSSTVVKLIPRRAKSGNVPSGLRRVVASSFKQRRKILINNLVPDLLPDSKSAGELLQQMSLSPNCRAEELSVEEFLKLTTLIESLKL